MKQTEISWGDVGVKKKKNLSRGEFGYFLELHISRGVTEGAQRLAS